MKPFAAALILTLMGCIQDLDAATAAGASPDEAQPVVACSSPQAVCPAAATECADLADVSTWRWSARADDAAAATRLVVSNPVDVVRGARAIRLSTASGSLAWLRYQAPSLRPIDAHGATALELVVRGRNTNTPAWQGTAPIVVLIDTAGRRRVLTPDRTLLSSDGTTWTRVQVPLRGGASGRGDASFSSSGWVDLWSLAAIEIGADTWGAGFAIDVDGVAFVTATRAAAGGCDVECPARCSSRGTCDQETALCACALGAQGAACESCTAGFIDEGGQCALPNDGARDVWPNDISFVNSDPWLAVHHDAIKTLSPKVLVLNFVNPSVTEDVAALVDGVVDGFAEASRPTGGGAPALQYELARSIVDLRDGVQGRPAAPAGYPYENSTLTPRRADGASQSVDYAALFSSTFASRYGWVNGSPPHAPADLCALVNAGLVHEVWVVVSGEVPDAGFAETLEMKPRYDLVGNRKEGDPARCAGNGCFEADVPYCGRSLRVLAINYRRGAGCALHSFGHGVEALGTRGIVPGLEAWFPGYAGFDLDQRFGVAFRSLYEVGCEDTNGDGLSDSTCVVYPQQDTAILHDRGPTSTLHPYDARCGNVHFPPNATWHYEYGNTAPVSSSCAAFGRSGATTAIDASAWSDLEPLASDCGGGFLIWWLRNMPRQGSSHAFADGAPMRSLWPYLFY